MTSSKSRPDLEVILEKERNDHYFGYTPYRKYFVSEETGTFLKRTLRKNELQTNMRGELIPLGNVVERSRNEAAALQFLKKNTSIPLPQVYQVYDDGEAHGILMEYVDGVELHELPDDQKPAVFDELRNHLESMHAITRPRFGGVESGLVCLPMRLADFAHTAKLGTVTTDGLVLCHGDLSQYNVIVEPNTLKVKAILDFEYAGFYPKDFDSSFYLRPGPSCALKGEYNDVEDLKSRMRHLIAQADETSLS